MKSLKYVVSMLLILLAFIGCATGEVESTTDSDVDIVAQVEEPAVEVEAEEVAPAQMEDGSFAPGARWPMAEGFDPASMTPPEGFDPNTMRGAMGGNMGFSVAKSEPIEFSVDESDLLYEISTISVSSPDIPETFYDAEDILNLEEYEIVVILLDGNSISTVGLPDGVTIESDGDVIEIVNSTDKKYNYYLEGNHEGTIVIESDDANYAVMFNDVELIGKTLPAMQLKSETKAFFYTAEDSVNIISDSPDNEKKGVITASGDIILSGKGELEVISYKKHGLKVDGIVRVLSGDVVVTCTEEATGDAIRIDNAYIQDGGNVTVYALCAIQGDESKGIKVDGKECDDPKGYIAINGGTLTIESVGKALTASWESEEDAETESLEDDPVANLYINNGVVKINTTGDVYEISDDLSLSPEGLEAKNNLIINGGLIELCTTDDALNAGDSIVINSGSVFAYTRSADAIDSNGIIEINGGLLVALGSTVPESAIDCDNDSSFTYNGGYLVALSGSRPQAPAGENSTGYTFSVGSFQPGESFALLDSESNVLLAFTVPSNFDRASMGIIAASEVKSGETYTLLRGVDVTADYFFNGAYMANIAVEGGEVYATVAPSSSVTALGGTAGGMNFGGGMMGPRGTMQMPEGFDPGAMRPDRQGGMWANPESQPAVTE